MLSNSFLFIVLLSAVADCDGQNHCAKTGHSGLIVNGQVSVPGKWPFVAALFNTTSQRFFCAGSLISWRHILTAAHCIQNKEKVTPTSPGNVVAYLGRYNLNSIHERGVVSADPAYFIIHPQWKPFASEYEADITVVVLKNEVPRSDNVHPVCLWPSNIKPVEAEVGTIVGWWVIRMFEGIPRIFYYHLNRFDRSVDALVLKISRRESQNGEAANDAHFDVLGAPRRIKESANIRTFCAR